MRYGSVCSGIEAATVAWHHLGWQPAFFSEIDRFPCEVLAHHYGSNLPGEELARNGVPNLGDMTKFQEWPDHAIDLLVGGTPCQSFSVAGLRAGLADPRGNLMLTYLAIAARYRPRWLVWENVPGVLSSGDGRDFGTFLQGLGELGYGFAYRVLDAQFVRVDGFPHAVPQRRRRVFVVGYLGDWRRAAAVFFDGASLRGDPPPRREAGQGVAHSLEASTGGVSGKEGRGLVAKVASTLNAAFGDKQGLENQHINEGAPLFICEPIAFEANMSLQQPATDGIHPTLTRRTHAAVAFDTTQITSKANGSLPKAGDPCHPLAAGAHPPAIAIQAGALRENPASGPDGVGVQEGIAYTDEARAEVQAVAWSIMPQNSGKDYKARAVDVAQPLMAGGPTGGNQGGDYIQQQWAVRRLTPTECERLQGFPEISKSVRIEVCEVAKSEAASSAPPSSQSQRLASSAPVLVHVLINLERSAVEIHKAGRLFWSASTAAPANSSPLSMPLDAFVRLAAHMTQTAVPQTEHGAAASPTSISVFFPRLHGSASVSASGQEIEELASDAEKFTATVSRCMKFITSPSGHNSQSYEPSLATLSCCVAAAISSCIPSETRQASSYAVIVETISGYTDIPRTNGKAAADGPRYKALGNSMAVNAMAWIGERIAMVDAIAEAEAAA